MCCSGKPTSYTSGNPQLDKYLTGHLGQTANQYPGPVSSQINPLMTNAANMMSMYGTGQPYQAPGMNTYSSMMGQYGGGAKPPAQTGGQAGGQNAMLMQMIQQLMSASKGAGGKTGR